MEISHVWNYWTWCVILYVWIAADRRLTSASSGGQGEYCMMDKFNATCGPGQVILMDNAQYGRMKFGRCVKENHGSIGCSSDVLPQLDSHCSGRHYCEMEVKDLHSNHPCPKELFSYLEASYICVKVQSTSTQECLIAGSYEVGGSGYLASITADEDLVGTARCPWVVTVPTGQRIILTLIDFGSQTYDQPLQEACGTDIVIEDTGKPKSFAACGDSLSRKRELYESDSNQISIYVEKYMGERPTFLINYTAEGCPDITHQENAWVTRKGDEATVKCNFTGETFFLSCDGSKWKGELGHCKATAKGSSRNVDEKDAKFPYGLLIVIGIGVALGVAFGILMLFAILFCVKRRKSRQTLGHNMDPLLSEHPPDPEDTMSNIYDKTARFVRCPHGLAINMHPDGVAQYYPEGLERVPLATVNVPYNGSDKLDSPPPTGENNRECIYNVDREQLNKSLTNAFNKRKNDMQAAFSTFRPGVILEETREDADDNAYRSLHNRPAIGGDQPLDLLRESRPQHREQNTDAGSECTCSLPEQQNINNQLEQERVNTAV